MKGIRAGMVQLKTIWPFPYDLVGDIAGRVDRIIVPEMNMGGQLIGEVERAAKGRCEVVGYSRVDGEPIAPPAEIVAKIEEV